MRINQDLSNCFLQVDGKKCRCKKYLPPSLILAASLILIAAVPCHAAWTKAAEPLGVTDSGLTSSSLQWADYDRDGDLDLAIAGWGTGGHRLIIYKNNGDTNFTIASEPMGVNAGVRYASIQWGDYDNDGDLDLAVAGQDGGAVERLIIFRNNGGDNFTNAAEPMGANVGLTYASIQWGDYDNDGDLDLVVSGSPDAGTSKRLIVYRNNGNGSFTSVAQPMGTNVGVQQGSVQWGDFDKDGDLDLAVLGREGGTTNRFMIFKNNGGDSFSLFAEPFGAGNGVYVGSIRWGDYDNDGDLDLVMSGLDGAPNSRLIIYKYNGSSFSSVAEPLGANAGVSDASIDWGDFDNDGDLDLAATGFKSSGVYTFVIFKNNGSDSFDIYAQPFTGGVGFRDGSIHWGDYDGDGDLDIAGTGVDLNGTNRFVIFRSDTASGKPNTRPSAPVLISPQAGVFSSGETITFKWNPVTGDSTPAAAMTYNLRVGSGPGKVDIVSADTNSSDSIGNTILGNVQNDTFATLVKNLSGGTYYWSVQAVDGGMMRSVWATEQTLTIDTVAGQVVLSNPPDGAQTSNASVVLAWNTLADSSGIDSYVVAVSKSSGFTSTVFVDTVDGTVTADTFTVSSADTFYWRVRAIDNLRNVGANSTVRGFVVDSNVGQVALSSPPYGAQMTSASVGLAWAALQDSTGIDSYVVEVSNSAAFSTLVFTDTVTGTLLSDTFTASTNDTYYWRVRAIDHVGNSGAYSTLRGFIIDSNVNPVSLSSPMPGAQMVTGTVALTWNSLADSVGIDSYVVEVAKTSGFTTTVVADTVDGVLTTDTFTGLYNDTFFWRVRSIDNLGNVGANSVVRGFVVDTAVGKVVLSSPASGSITIDSTPTLSWAALADSVGIDSYIVEISNSPMFASTVFVDTVSKTSDTVMPGLVADTYFWRVKAIDHLQNVGAYSDSFTLMIDTTHTLTVSAPNGGEVWFVGDMRTITWTATGVIPNVKLEFSADSGSTFPNRITDSTANTGSYAWLVPDSICTTTRVKISDVVDSTITDSSDANFTIRGGFNITRPNGMDSFQAGTAENITWTNTGTISSVRLEYSVDSGVTWSVIVASTSNTGTYAWTVPNMNTAQAKVRILSATDTATNDTSDDVFRINPVTVLPPPDTILISAGNHQLGTPSSSLPLTIRVVDTGGSNGVLGARVTFTVTHGSGSLSSSVVYTDATGYATDTLTLGAAAGVYRVEARNDSVTPAKAVVFTVYVDGRDIPPGGSTLGQGWRMVGANKAVSGWNLKSTSGGLPNATVYEWLPDQPDVSGLNNTKYYAPSGDAVRGRAYWIKDANGGRVFVPSDGYATADTVQVRLKAGWNQVASGQYFYVSWDSGVAFDTSGVNDTMLPVNQRLSPAQAGTANIIQNKIYWYTGSTYVYAPASETPSLVTSQLKPMVGMWLYVEKSCTMFIYPNPASPETYAAEILNQAPAYLSANYGQAADNDWAIQLIATAGGNSDWQNYIGAAATSKKRHASSALEAPPVAAGYVTLAVREPGSKDWMAATYGEPITTGKTWDVMVSSDLGPATVTWDNVANLPPNYEAYLIGTGTPVNLRKASSVLVTSPATLTLAVGLPEYVAPFLASPLSKEQTFAYPNPAADNVTFKYNLQSAGDVTIRIFDVGGRLVRELKGSGIAGSNTSVWDTTNKNGQKVGSGVYIYRIESGGDKLVDKLAVVK